MGKLLTLDDYVDWTFVKTIISPREFTNNLSSRRKQVYVAVYGMLCFIFALVLFQQRTVVGAYLVEYVEYSILSVAVVLYSVEPCILLLQALIFAHPGADEGDGSTTEPDLSNKDIAIVISCHRSSDVICKTVEACLKHVGPAQIFVMDNANFLESPDTTREVLEEADFHEVNYIYNPFGNKTLAMYAGSVAAKDYKYCLLIDDDVTIPENMKFGKHLFDDTIRAVCYPIKAVHPQGRTNSLFIEWQAIEYKMSDYSKLLQNEFATVLYPHGAICLWERETLISCFREHDTIFFADDVKMGLWFQRKGYEMRMYHKSMVETDAPTTIVGPYPNYYNQRVRSWDMAEHAYAYEFFRVLFFTRHKTLFGTVVLKWFQFYSCYSVAADWVRIPVMTLTIWVSWKFFVIISGAFFVLYTLLTVAWDYIGYRKCPERRSRPMALLTFQFYKIPSIFIRLMGMGRAFLIYLPNFVPKPTIPALELEYMPLAADQDASSPAMAGVMKFPVWLDKSSPYFAHYDPKRPAQSCRAGSLPDETDDEPMVHYRPIARDPDSDSVTTLTMDDALMRVDDFRRGPLPPLGEKSREVVRLSTFMETDEEQPREADPKEVPSSPMTLGVSPVSGGDSVSSTGSSLRDSFYQALSTVKEESEVSSGNPSSSRRRRQNEYRTSSGQPTSDSGSLGPTVSSLADSSSGGLDSALDKGSTLGTLDGIDEYEPLIVTRQKKKIRAARAQEQSRLATLLSMGSDKKKKQFLDPSLMLEGTLQAIAKSSPRRPVSPVRQETAADSGEGSSKSRKKIVDKVAPLAPPPLVVPSPSI